MKKITIKSKGTCVFRPDWMDIVITIKAADTSYNKAMTHLAEKIGKLVDCIEELGMDINKLRTIQLTSDIVDYVSAEKECNEYKAKGIMVTQKFRIGVEFVVNDIEAIVGAISNCEISAEIMLIQTVKDRERLKKELILKCLKESRKKAKAMAKAAKAKLGKVVSVKYLDKSIESECYVSQEFFNNKFAPITCGYLFERNFLPDEIEITDEVEVVWRLR